MATITKKDLIDRISANTGLKRTDVRNVLQEFLDEVIGELGNGNRLEFRDFGVFEIKNRAPRTAQNPKTMERVVVPSKKTVKFKIGRLMKQQLDEGDDGFSGPTPPHAGTPGGSGSPDGVARPRRPAPRGRT